MTDTVAARVLTTSTVVLRVTITVTILLGKKNQDRAGTGSFAY